MNPLVRTLVLGGLVLAGAVYGINYHNDTVARLEFEKGHEALRSAYVERAGWMRSIANEDRYRDELVSLNKWYDASLADLHNRFPGRFVEDAPLKELEAQKAAGQLKAEDFNLKKEFFDLTKTFSDLIASGRYSPVLTSVSNGVRLDVVGVKREPHEGRQALRVDVVAWGAPRREISQRSDSGKSVTSRMQLDFALKELNLEFTTMEQPKNPKAQPEEKLYGEFKAGAPTMTVEYPERWLPAFPPQAALMTYWIEPMPREATSVTWKLSGEVRSPSGGPLPFVAEWKVTPQADWQLKEGEKFEAEERVMPEEEMRRGAGAE